MAFFTLFLKRQIVKRAKKKLKNKLDKKRHKFSTKFKSKLGSFLKSKFRITEDSWIYKKYNLLRTDGTFENFMFTSLLGFLGGILLTYVFFFFFVFQLNFSLTSATILCSIFGVILTLGLAYSMRIRCIVFLLLPQFCSKRGRQAVMAYAFILTLTGPARNTLHNIGVLSESLACGQDQLKEAVKVVMDLIKQPFYTLKNSVTKIIKSVKVTVKRIKQSLVAIKRLVISILDAIKAVFQWLASVVNICNKTLGTPYDRCTKVFEDGVVDCKAKLGPMFDKLCDVLHPIKAVCYIVKPFDLICELVSYIADVIVDTVEKRIHKFTTEMRALFYVKVKFSHSFKFETNQSRTFEEVSSGIVSDIRRKTEEFLTFFDWMGFFTTFFFFFMLLRVFHYRYKWLTSDRYDNRYITKYVQKIDAIRSKQDKETILPLGFREKRKYATLTAFRLIKSEKLKLAKSTVFLSLATFKFLFHMAADYSLYWMLDMIRYHGRIELKVQKPNSIGIHVSGTGFLAELYKSVIKAFSPMGEETYVNNVPCLPEPTPPDYDRYTQIVILVTFCWLMTFVEPYGLRLRHVVMNYYHPDRARQRAVWLYNHIIRSRGTFLKFARRQLRRKFGISNGQYIEKVTLVDRIYGLCPFINFLFPREENNCILCGVAEKSVPHVRCSTPNCVGLYCAECFSDLQNLCTICKSPLEYGDYSDLSEEKDSSEDDIGFDKLSQFGEIVEKSSVDLTEITKEGTDTEDSLSNYSYQYESPSETIFTTENMSSKDIEAQKLRDDVTTQIFTYSDDDLTSDESYGPMYVRKPIFDTNSTVLSKNSQSGPRLFAPEMSPSEILRKKKSDKVEKSDLLLTRRHDTRFKSFVENIWRLFTSKERRDKVKKKKPVEEMKELLEKMRQKSPAEDKEEGFIEQRICRCDSEETILFLNVPEGSMTVDCADGDYLFINNDFYTDSESEENLRDF